ncbi:hypothetical protein K2X89_00245, partial [Myxococcota bacterium]|nr:hypothetical protein [Myxococcota bacterium]
MLHLARAMALIVLGLSALLAPSARAVELALQSGWSATPGAATPEAFLDRGVVYFRGAISGGTTGFVFTLPPEMRPETHVYALVALCNARAGRLFIQSSGAVQVQAKFGGFADAQCSTSLDGASFVPSASGFPVLALTNGWTHAPYQTSSAAAALQDGIVRFKGALAQGSSGLAFTLPPAMRPQSVVYVPVGLCGANKGRLMIQPSGVVQVQAATSFGEANCFTSLDGAWFAPSPAGFGSLTLESGWTPTPYSTSDVAAVLSGGVVRFKGAMSNGTNAQAFTLPRGLRPQTDVQLPIDLCAAREGRLLISASGSVSVEAASGFGSGDAQCFTSLDGASFLPTPRSLTRRPLPYLDASVPLSNTSPQTISIDLATLPTRPVLIVEVTPPPNRLDMQLQIEATNFVPTSGYTFT